MIKCKLIVNGYIWDAEIDARPSIQMDEIEINDGVYMSGPVRTLPIKFEVDKSISKSLVSRIESGCNLSIQTKNELWEISETKFYHHEVKNSFVVYFKKFERKTGQER